MKELIGLLSSPKLGDRLELVLQRLTETTPARPTRNHEVITALETFKTQSTVCHNLDASTIASLLLAAYLAGARYADEIWSESAD